MHTTPNHPFTTSGWPVGPPATRRPARGGTVTIYRTEQGRREISDWCEQRLAGWEQPHERSILQTALGPTHVVTAGAGPPLVLVPGTSFATASWLDLVAALAVRHTVHALDLPGQPGLSSPRRPRRDRDPYGPWLADLLPRLSDAPVTLVGHSLGALVVLAAAARGTPVARLLVLDPAGVARLGVPPGALGPAIARTRGPDPGASADASTVSSAPDTTPEAHHVAWMSLVGRHVRTSSTPSPLARADLDRLHRIPTAVLSGRGDASLPAARRARWVRRRLPAATVRVVEATSHLVPLQRPDLVAHELEALTSAAGR